MIKQPVRYGALPENGYARSKQVLEAIPVSRATLWRMVKAGKFPAPVKLGPRITAWPASSVRAWLDAQAPQAQK